MLIKKKILNNEINESIKPKAKNKDALCKIINTDIKNHISYQNDMSLATSVKNI